MSGVVTGDLLLEFFLTFSKFEFALKRAGYFVRKPKATESYRAKPDWAAFASAIAISFMKTRTPELQGACDRILQNHPHEECVAPQGGRMWNTRPIREATEVGCLLGYVKRIRNNLFHGGKFEEGQNFNEHRNASLLRDALVVLKECLNLSMKVRREYDAATL